ncbi:hypothetical protein CCO03_00985 [Comamonas serinivorans]|uniref:Uncharacterized protein n=1 Tax=Comamonas serinivorans TaxID=1082851 RepID=A0A1Y0EIJ4_9BURK|nr:hypothetical protein [Comamonas serinivorans]ARU03443.1 hypothetical protein CCO03_00985 [Comamonas serinivorans]
MRKIKLANAQKRDAEVVYGGLSRKPRIVYTLPTGERARNVKVLKASVATQYETLLQAAGSDEALSQALVDGDPELDLNQTGRFIRNSQRILVNAARQPVYKVKVTERIFGPDGELKGEKDKVSRSQNVMAEVPVSWTGKKMPIAQAYNRFIFGRTYQLTHTNGLSFDFLFAMAKDLHEQQALMLVGAGPKGTDPLVFQEEGRPYRAFLEGRVRGEEYLLLMHLSNLELKPLPEGA